MNEKRDITVFGATGFTGKLTALYLAEHAPAEVKVAIAGRSRSKLEQVRDEVAQKTGKTLEIVEASVDDPSSLKKMAEGTRVIATTVGPYARYGEPLVAAAVEAGADGIDITGEPEFVSNVIGKYDARAKERGVRIVDCCGFDSIPHDLGTYYTVSKLDRSAPIQVEGFVSAKGTVSGGTWHSAVNAFSKLRTAREDAVFLATPGSVSNSGIVRGTCPPKSSLRTRIAPRIAFAFCRKNPVWKMSRSSSSWGTAR